jgi:hypothetical protein
MFTMPFHSWWFQKAGIPVEVVPGFLEMKIRQSMIRYLIINRYEFYDFKKSGYNLDTEKSGSKRRDLCCDNFFPCEEYVLRPIKGAKQFTP